MLRGEKKYWGPNELGEEIVDLDRMPMTEDLPDVYWWRRVLSSKILCRITCH